MKKLLSYVIVFSMLVSSLTVLQPSVKTVNAASQNVAATFIANRFVKLGFDRDGLPLYPARLFPWQKTAKIQVWGRTGFEMPNAYYARQDGSNVNIPAISGNAVVVPVLWCDMYFTVEPDSGKSQEYDHWYAVLDSAGQLWLDPDGTFHDPRYNPYVDPTNKLYKDGGCRTGSNKQNGISRYAVDPASDNNTQGPYILNPSHQLFSTQPITVTIEGTRYGSRKFQLGYVDMVDYPPERIVTNDSDVTYTNKPNDEHGISFRPTTVLPYQWDLGFPLVSFRNFLSNGTVSQTDEMFHEYHNRTRNSNYGPLDPSNFISTYGNYEPYEYIYRKGPGNLDPTSLTDPTPWFTGPTSVVQVGDIRLCDMSFRTWDGAGVKNYPAGSVVKLWDVDAPQDYDHNNVLETDEVRFLFFFAQNMKHTETLVDGRNISIPSDITNIYYDVQISPALGYTRSEWIYMDRDFDPTDGVSVNGDNVVTTTNPTSTTVQPDLRYSPVNTKQETVRPFAISLLNGNEPYTIDDFNRSLIGAYPYNYQTQVGRGGLGLVGWDAITKTQGDVLVFAEVLKGGCESPTYNISVETDVWMGTDVGITGPDKRIMPSVTAARLRSPNGDIEVNSQRIQKNTVLGPNGTSYFIPATTFQNIRLGYREYMGVEIFKDNGIDNHIGINLPQDKVFEQNLTDDYMDERTGEEFLGSTNGVNAKDFGYYITPFPFPHLLADKGLHPFLQHAVDPNLTPMTWKDFDPTDVLYYDTNPNLDGFTHGIPTYTYGCGEPIYQNRNTKFGTVNGTAPGQEDTSELPSPTFNDLTMNHIVNAGDIRITAVTVNIAGNEVTYAAGTTVAEGDVDVGFRLNYFNNTRTITTTFGTDVYVDFRYGYTDTDFPKLDIAKNYMYNLGEGIYDQIIPNTLQEAGFWGYWQAWNTDNTPTALTPTVSSGYIRLTPVTINGTTYTCGSPVSTGDYWYYQNPIQMIGSGKNCDFRFMDEIVNPGPLSLQIKMDQPFKVEQTSQVDVTLKTPLKQGEEVYLVVSDVWAPTDDKHGMVNPSLIYQKLDYNKQSTTMQITPYRGSCGELATNFPLRIMAFKDVGGVSNILPPTQQIDLFYQPLLKKDEKGEIPNTDAPTPSSPPLPLELTQAYDCYSILEYKVIPEELRISSSQKCIGTLDQRFPNMTLRLYDGDNPGDINDPSGMRISLPFGHLMIANYNAHDAGIDYLVTGYKMDGEIKRKVIVQVNDDRTFLYWYWQDNAPFDILNDTDIVAKSPFFPNDPDPIKNQPGYNKSYELLTWYNDDCSDKNDCLECGADLFRSMNEITRGDSLKVGNDVIFRIGTFGVPVSVNNYAELTPGDPGGEIRIVVVPMNAGSKLKLRTYIVNALYDYNSTIQHPPDFVYDRSMGIDYCGTKEFKVLPADPYLNFAEMRIVDHSLQFSQQNYTSGVNDPSHPPTTPMPYPTPQIQAPYDPILKDYGRDFRAYPGGDTHMTRMIGFFDMNLYFGYPAIWNWYWYDNVDMNKFTDFNKLGTEFLPLTDYGINFIMKDSEQKVLTLDPKAPMDRRVNRIVVEGPFKRPMITDWTTGKMTVELIKGNMLNLPILYDWSGKLVIDSTNYQWYEYVGADWTQTVGFGPDKKIKQYRNSLLASRGDLNYTGLDHVIRIDELIPVGAGNTTITVELADGTKKIFQDCCTEPPSDGLTTHGLSISGLPKTLEVGSDHKVEVKVEELESYQPIKECNNALVYIWQDRGIRINMRRMGGGNMGSGVPDMDMQFGMVDGHCEGLPLSSAVMKEFAENENAAVQFPKDYDQNDDGKISFADYETEIMGIYDLATNTWRGGLVDGRTFNADSGKYVFDLSESNGAKLVDMGTDIGFLSMGALDDQGMDMADADHVISKWEVCPVYVNAYKYGDDNNDRAFIPGGDRTGAGDMVGDQVISYSHEVYLAGEARIMPSPIQDLSVTVSPSVLTAGVVPELVDPDSPLSFRITDTDGRAVDLTKGVDLGFLKGLPLRFRATEEGIWKNLFVDDPPEPLPQYYWLRTDLHNVDDSPISNERMFSTQKEPFRPITVDFNNASIGKYTFRGFCANDKGEFDVYIYTPDRTHMGIARVKVELPKVEYSVVNTEDSTGTVFSVPGDPDFVLTAADNRIYKVTATIRDARGLLIKGVTKGVSTCGGGAKNTARFTPYTSRGASWDFNERDRFLFASHFMQDLYSYNFNIAFDFNDNQKIDQKNAELFTFGGVKNIKKGLVYYNTTNVLYDNGEWDVKPNVNLPPFSDSVTQKPIPEKAPKRGDNPTGTALLGWGYGAIYNSPYHGGYLLIDIDNSGFMDYRDSLGLDVNGQTTFYLFAEDLAFMGGLVGQNGYANALQFADLAGNPPPNKTDPGIVYKRFNQSYSSDNVFFLDWEAFPNQELTIKPPQIKVLDAETRIAQGKDLLGKNNYDLVYSIENHIVAQVMPADPRDLPIHEDGRVFMLGNQHQTAIYGNVKPSKEDPKIMETVIHFTPTGLGENIAFLGFYNPNRSYLKAPYELKNTSTYTLMDLIQFDSALGLQIEAFTDGPVLIKASNELTVRVTEIGTGAPVEGATVKIEGPGVSGSKLTDKSGVAIFPIIANAKGKIMVTATKEGKVIGRKEIRIVDDLSRPFLDMNPLPPYTNKPTVEVTGYTNPGNTVTLNGSISATVNDKGTFTAQVTLKEGLNTIIGEAKNSRGEITKGSVSITLDTVPPEIFIDDPGMLVDVSEINASGRTEPNCTVIMNGSPVTLTYDIFRGILKVSLGKNTITIQSTDKAGNVSTKTHDFYVYHKIVLNLTIDNRVILIDGIAQPELEYPPFISQGRTLVPIRIISEALGAKVDWDPVTKNVTITLAGKVIVMTIDKSTATIDGKQMLLDAPPMIRLGRTFVPLRFISEAFGAEVLWDAATRTVTVNYLK